MASWKVLDRNNSRRVSTLTVKGLGIENQEYGFSAVITPFTEDGAKVAATLPSVTQALREQLNCILCIAKLTYAPSTLGISLQALNHSVIASCAAADQAASQAGENVKKQVKALKIMSCHGCSASVIFNLDSADID